MWMPHNWSRLDPWISRWRTAALEECLDAQWTLHEQEINFYCVYHWDLGVVFCDSHNLQCRKACLFLNHRAPKHKHHFHTHFMGEKSSLGLSGGCFVKATLFQQHLYTLSRMWLHSYSGCWEYQLLEARNWFSNWALPAANAWLMQGFTNPGSLN